MNDHVLARLRRVEPMLTAADIAVRWRLVADHLLLGGRVFCFTTPSGLRLYPEVQFDDEGPRAAVAMILAALAAQRRDGTELCEWFYAPRTELDGVAAADVLVSAPHRVVALALDPEVTRADVLDDAVGEHI